MPVSAEWIRQLPKVELHVHVEGSIRPETVLRLAEKHGISLPATDLEGLKHWYEFRDFAHFVEVYIKVTECVRTVEDLEFVLREFIRGQAEQNIVYTEATYTASTVETRCGIPFAEQLGALQRARAWGKTELGVDVQFVLDIVRGDRPERAMQVMHWVADSLGQGVCALGIAGFESRGTVIYREVFAEAQRLGIPVTAHAGETEGAWSVAETLDITGAHRIGHGIRSIEDPDLITRLRDERVVLEVCPTSNVCLGVVPLLSQHPLPKLMEAGVAVTVNSDDPPMFGTTLTDEWIRCAEAFEWDESTILRLNETAIEAAFLDEEAKRSIPRPSRSG
jgi:adenosine deaminase